MLPDIPTVREMFQPAETPEVGIGLIEHSKARDVEWEARHANDDEAEGVGPVWASELGKCARQISYRLQGLPRDPMDDVGRHVVELGNVIHEALQADYPDEDVEVGFQILDEDTGEPMIIGRIDLRRVNLDGEREVVDFKSAGSFSFENKLNREGVDVANVLQVAAGMLGVGVGAGRVAYVGKEALNKPKTRKAGLEEDDVRRVVLEFPFTLEQVDAMIGKEMARVAKIRRFVAEGRPVPRVVPYAMPPGPTLNPNDGSWQQYEDGHLFDSGKVWQCGYCSYQEVCIKDFKVETAFDHDGEPPADSHSLEQG